MSQARKLDVETVAAWVLRSSPDVYDVETAIASGEVPEGWRLAYSYRVDMIDIGDPVVLWLSGSASGIIAAGAVAGPPDMDQGGTRYWIDEEEKAKVRPYLPVELHPVSKIEKWELMSDRRFNQAEVIRVPQMGNPSYLTDDEFALVRELMGLATVKRVGWMPD